MHAQCVSDPTVRRVTERIGAVTMTPQQNAEFFQVVRYEPGQFYKIHHVRRSPPSRLRARDC